MSTKEQMDKQNEVYPYNEILLGHKKKWSTNTHYMKLENNMLSKRSQSQKTTIIWLYSHEMSRIRKSIQRQSKLVVA